MKILCTAILGLLIARLAFSHGGGGPEGANFGPDKGVTEFSEEVGFKLSPEAMKKFELVFTSVSGAKELRFANTSFVYSGEEVSIYRLRSGWIKRVDVKVLRRGVADSLVSTKDLSAGDQVATTGSNWIRVAELDGLGDEANHKDEGEAEHNEAGRDEIDHRAKEQHRD